MKKESVRLRILFIVKIYILNIVFFCFFYSIYIKRKVYIFYGFQCPVFAHHNSTCVPRANTSPAEKRIFFYLFFIPSVFNFKCLKQMKKSVQKMNKKR